MLPRTWRLAWLTAAVGIVVVSVLELTVPPWPAAAFFALALILSGAGIRMGRWERDASRPARTAIAYAVATVLGSSAALGAGFAVWLYDYALNPFYALGAMLCMGAVLATVMSGRIGATLSAQLALWTPMMVLRPTISGAITFGVSFAVLFVVYRMQRKIDYKRARRREMKVRVSRRAQDILSEYENAGQGWFWETDRRGQLNYISPHIANVLGATPEQLLGQPLVTMFETGADSREGDRTVSFHLSARSNFQELAVRAATRTEERWWSVTGRPIYDSFDNFCGFRGSGSDLTEKRRSQADASRLASYDSLTGLANRFEMAQTLDKILAAPLERDRECNVFLLDLDRFKQVNDTLGHPVGDVLLTQVAGRLERAVGKLGRVGRLGGDEFQIVLPGRISTRKLGELGGIIIHSLTQPYSIDGHSVVIGASIGIAISPKDGDSSEDIIRNADLALYAAKDGGRGRYHFYSSDLHSAAEERVSLEQDLREAIANGGLELHYQPVVSTATERISGFEALLRWNHPTRGWLSPAKFIPIAEDSGLIIQIGEWALRTACQDMASWSRPVRCAVNVSPLQFASKQFPAIVTSALAHAQIDPARLELELTESVFLADGANTDAMFAALKKIGVRLALDDFGTGYSSLGYLKKAPFDKIKIDQSFVRGATQKGSRNGALIESITGLAQALDMDTTAEGVETLDELQLVRVLGCSHVQGYIYEKALPPEKARDRLANGLALKASGPRSARAPRQTMLRQVVLEHGGAYYNATIRNISETGALLEGLAKVPVGTQFNIAITETLLVTATTRWCERDRIGLEFATELKRQPDGGFIPEAPYGEQQKPLLRKTG